MPIHHISRGRQLALSRTVAARHFADSAYPLDETTGGHTALTRAMFIDAAGCIDAPELIPTGGLEITLALRGPCLYDGVQEVHTRPAMVTR